MADLVVSFFLSFFSVCMCVCVCVCVCVAIDIDTDIHCNILT